MQKPEPKLAHMPKLVKQKITDLAPDIGTKLALYQVSKEFQSIARNSPITYNHIRIQLQVEKVRMSMEAGFQTGNGQYDVKKTLVMEFFAHEKGALQKNPTSNWEKSFQQMDYRKAAIQYLLEYMGPKTKVEKITLCGDESLLAYKWGFDPEDDEFPAVYPKRKFDEDRKMIMGEIERALQAKRRQLLVGKISFKFRMTSAHILQILQCLEAGTLTDIELSLGFPRIGRQPELASLEHIFETSQWRQAKCVDFEQYISNIPVEQFTHFTKLRICQRRPSISVKTIVETFMNSTNLIDLRVNCIEAFNETHDASYYLEQLNLPVNIRGIFQLPDHTRIRVHNPPNRVSLQRF